MLKISFIRIIVELSTILFETERNIPNMERQPEIPGGFIRFLSQYRISNPVICDIGSRDALEGLCLFRTLCGKQLHLFEPNPIAAERCKQNLARGNCQATFFNEVAVSDHDGTADFYAVDLERSENKDIGFSSFLLINPKYTKRRKSIIQKKIAVRTITLNSYFADKSQPDILWIDVEGAELLVLKGASRILPGVKIIHIEVSFRAMHCGKPLFSDIDYALKQYGFSFYGFSDTSLLKSFLYRYRVLPKLPWRLNAIYYRPL
jgi:2-O-methyltransferase